MASVVLGQTSAAQVAPQLVATRASVTRVGERNGPMLRHARSMFAAVDLVSAVPPPTSVAVRRFLHPSAT